MTEKIDIPDEIELLLPWYAAGTLDETELAQVENYLEEHPEVRKQLDLIDEEMSVSIRANETIAGPSAGALDNLMAQVEAEGTSLSQTARAAPGAFTNWLSDIARGFTAPAMKVAGALAAVVIVVQGLALANLMTGSDDGSKYAPASGGGEITAPSGPAFLVRFQPQAQSSEIARILKSSGLRIVDGPKPGNVFRLVAAPGAAADAERLLAALKAETDVVSFVVRAETAGAK